MLARALERFHHRNPFERFLPNVEYERVPVGGDEILREPANTGAPEERSRVERWLHNRLSDFTVIEEASPERRNAQVFAAGPTGAYMMGGKTDCGVVDDLARFNFASEEWETLTRATIGEVCLRKGGGDTCSGLCL